MTADHALANRTAYDIWAETYPPVPHNPLMRAEQRAVESLWPEERWFRQARALDLACGTGRYSTLLERSGAAHVVSLDFSAAMLGRMKGAARIRGDMMQLPFAACTVDIVVSGLAVGHAPRLDSWIGEIARVLKPGGILLYSDFHPDAAAAGMTRSFMDAGKRQHTLQHCRHEIAEHWRAAQAACLEIDAVREVRVGFELREGFAGADAFYRRWHGLPVVFAARAHKATPDA